MNSIYEELCNFTDKKNIYENEDMKSHVTFRAGGKARYFVTPESNEELGKLISYVSNNNIKYFVMGNGSNLLFKDEGFDGVVIKIGKPFSEIRVNGDEIYCGAGALLSKVASAAYDNSLTGFEFAAGIPGFIGGAVAMNAGAYGGEFKDVVVKVFAVDSDGKNVEFDNSQMEFGYRTSAIQNNNYIVTGALIKLRNGNKTEILEEMNRLMTARKEKQPLEFPSAGSTFKRPEGYFAGKLIMDAGLRGYSVGDACVSEKHCGFVINKGNATASDIIKLIENVSDIVFEKFGVRLETEVKII